MVPKPSPDSTLEAPLFPVASVSSSSSFPDEQAYRGIVFCCKVPEAVTVEFDNASPGSPLVPSSRRYHTRFACDCGCCERMKSIVPVEPVLKIAIVEEASRKKEEEIEGA